MATRKKGRNRFRFASREFSWWIDNDTFLRISSVDKRFIVAYLLFDPDSVGPLLVVHGPEFPEIQADTERPIWLIPPEFTANNMGRNIADLLNWCFTTKNHQRFLGSLPPYVF